jgi:hypothetical protein
MPITKTPIRKSFMKRLSVLFSSTIIFTAVISLMGLADSARCQDVEPPTIVSAVFDNANTEIILTFSEPMDPFWVLEPANYEVIEPSGASRYAIVVAQEGSGFAQYRLTLDAAASAGSSLTVYYVTDLAGNFIDPIPTTVPIQGPADTTRPTVVSAVFANLNTAVIVTFSETMHQGQAEEPANYLVTEPSGAFLEIVSITQQDAAGRQYRLNLNAAASSGSELTVFEVSDLALNVIDPNPTTLAIQDAADETRPTVLSAVFDNNSNTVISVTFNEAMHPAQVFDPAHYFVTDPSGEILPVAIVSQQNAAGTQYLLYLSATAESGSQLTISDVSDLALNVIDPNPTTLPVLGGGDTTPPTVSATVSTPLLTPPNHKAIDVGLTVTASDNVTANPFLTLQVISDEALSAGDASYTNGVLSLRATRDNAGDGRVYLIVVTAADEAGNAASTCTTVVVPYSNSPSDIATVQAQAAALCR